MAKKFDVNWTLGIDDHTAEGISAAMKNLEKVQGPIEKMQAHWRSLDRTVGITAGVMLAQKAYSALQRGLEVYGQAVESQQKRISFDNLVRNINVNSTKIIADLKRASDETISLQSAIDAAGRSFLLGLEADTLPKLMEIARASSKITGQSVTQAFDDITIGVARQSKLILDNLGIILDYDKHLKMLGTSLGKTETELNDVERRQAFLNATMEAGEKIVAKVGTTYETLQDRMQKFKASLADSTEQIKAQLFGLNLIDKAVAGSRYPQLTEQYKDAKAELDKLLPKYNELKEAVERVSAGQGEPSRFLAENFLDTQLKVAALQAQLNEITVTLGLGKQLNIIEEKNTQVTENTIQDWTKWEKDYAALVDRAGNAALKTLDDIDKRNNEVVVNGRSLEELVDLEFESIEAGWKQKEAEMKNSLGYRLGENLGEGISYGAERAISDGLFNFMTNEFSPKGMLVNTLRMGGRLLADSFAQAFLESTGLKFSLTKFFTGLLSSVGGAAAGGGVSAGMGGGATAGGGGLSGEWSGGLSSGLPGGRAGVTNNFNYYITDNPTLEKRINESVRKSLRENNLRQDVKGL